MSNQNRIDNSVEAQQNIESLTNNKSETENAFSTIATCTAISFTICILCWMFFELYPNWTGTGVISTSEAVRDICVSLATCLCMSILGYVSFSEKFITKISLPLRFCGFALFGYGIISAWVFGSGWCPPQGFALFTIICVVAFAFSGLMIFISSKTKDKKLSQQLSAYKNK